eukprot:gene16575-19688_t
MGRIKDSDSEGEDPNAVWAPDRKKKKRKAVSEERTFKLPELPKVGAVSSVPTALAALRVNLIQFHNTDYNATVKKRNFKFKRFKQRVKEVDVNVFKRVGKARAEPLEGCDSFLQEAINEWRELNTAESFCEVVQALHEKCGSLILIVHHQSHILDVILSKFQYQEQLSLDGLLALMEALARDLENDFYPHLPRVIDSIVELLADGAVRDTDLIQHIFTRLNQVFKYTRRSLAADLPGVLRMTVALRHQRHGYIRHFVAVGLGFIFRSSKDIASGFQFLIEEAAAHNPGKHDISRSELAHSLGELVAEIVKGVSNGLHSRTEEWLQHSLTQQRKSVGDGDQGFLLTEANSALEDPDRDSVVQAVLQINLVSCATEFYRGSRVPDYAPLFQLVERALDTAPAPEAVGTPKATRTRRSQAAAAQVGAVMEKDQRLPEAALRLILALTAAHMREVGASGGASVIASNLTRWAPAFRNASPAVALSSVARLQSEVGRGHFLGIYAEVVFEVVERCIQEGGEICSKAAALLGDVCEALRQAGKLPAGRKKGERRMLLEARAPPTLVQWIDIASSAASRAAAADLADVHVCLQAAGGSTEWWATLGTADSTLFARVDLATLVRMRPKLLSGFLNTAQDLLGHLGDHTRHFMDPLLSLTLRLLQHACSSGPEEDAHNGVNGGAVGDEKSATAMRRPREMRGQCLKLLGTMLDRYPDADFEPYWPTLLEIMGPMAERLAGEAAGAASSGGRPPAMLEVVRVMAENKELAPGGVVPQAELLLEELRVRMVQAQTPPPVVNTTAGKGQGATTGPKRKPQRPHKALVPVRELSMLQRLAPHAAVGSGYTGALVAALLPFLQAYLKQRKLPELAIQRVLDVLGMLFHHTPQRVRPSAGCGGCVHLRVAEVASHTAVRLAVEMALGHVGAGRRALLTVLPRSLALATRHAGSLVAVRSAAELLQALQNGVESEGADGELYALLAQEGSEDAHVSEAAEALGWGALREALGGPLGLNLQHPSADMRLQTLSVFAHFQPPPPVQGPGVSAAEVKAPAELGLTMYGMGALRNITAGELNLDAGRHTQVSLGKVHKKLAAKLVPEELVAAVCRALVGCLHVRFSLLWDPATEALGAALSQYPLLAWPVVHAALIDCQAEALGGGAVEAKGGAPADDGEGAVTGLATLSQSAKAAQAILVDSTDATTRLGHLLKTLGKAPGIANNRIKELAPMFMAYTTAVTSPEGSAVDEDMETEVEPAEEETAVSTQVVAKDAEVRRGGGQGHQWRIGLRAWLELVGHLKALRSAEHTDLADALCRLLQTLLGDIDPGVQRLSLAALKVWKLQWLMPYMEHLENLCEPDNLREELTRFVVGRDVEGVLILEEHRREVTPVIIRLLQPSLRRRTGRLGGRGAPGSARSAVLNFL